MTSGSRCCSIEPADIDIARRLLAGQDAPSIPNGRVVRETGVNTGYSWSLDPNDIEFGDVTVEVCDGLPSDVEAGTISRAIAIARGRQRSWRSTLHPTVGARPVRRSPGAGRRGPRRAGGAPRPAAPRRRPRPGATPSVALAAARGGHVDDDPRAAGPVAQQSLDGLHRAHQPIRGGAALEADVQDRSGPAATGASAPTSATIRARASSGTDGSSSGSSAIRDARPAGST